MLRIRPEQVEALHALHRRRFESDLAAHLRARFPEETRELDGPGLQALIRDGTRRARVHGIEGRSSLRRFVERMLVHGPTFDVDLDWARRILGDPARTPRGKMDAIADHETFVLRTSS